MHRTIWLGLHSVEENAVCKTIRPGEKLEHAEINNINKIIAVLTSTVIPDTGKTIDGGDSFGTYL